MPTLDINRKVFEKLVGAKLSTDELKTKIAMLGTDLKSISSSKIVVEIFPNRPDMLSEQGFARAFSSFIGIKPGIRKYRVMASGERVIIEKSVKQVRPCTACAIVKGIRFNDEMIREIMQLQEKLHITYGRNRKRVAIGIYPLERIEMPIRFVGLEPSKVMFRPLDFRTELNGVQILERHPAGRAYGHLLKGARKFPFFIDAKGKVLSMPPIINSDDVGRVTTSTKDIFIECSGFDFDVLKVCLNIIVTSLADMGGQIYSIDVQDGKTIYRMPDLSPKQMEIDIERCNKLLGLSLNEAELKKLLERMGYGYRAKKVLIPAYRADIMHQVDLFEDIAIAYGYENLKPELPDIATVAAEDMFEVFKRRIAEICVGLGLVELNTYNMTNEQAQCKKMNFSTDLIRVLNAVNIEYDVMRAWLIPCILEVLSKNKHNEYPQNVFDIGDVFKKNPKTESGVEERTHLVVGLCDVEVDFTKARQMLDYLLSMLGLKCQIKEIEHSSFIEGRVGSVVVNGKKIGIIGEIAPDVLKNWDLIMPVVAFELDLVELFGLLS